MSRTAVIHQPDFLPHLGFFERLLHTDTFVYLDTVQYVDRGWINRDKIKTPQGEKWITVSVRKAPRATPINQIELSDAVDWRADHLNLLRSNYHAAPFFEEIYPKVEALYAGSYLLLSDFNRASIEMLMNLFSISVDRILLASELQPVGKNNDLLVSILKQVEADHYLSGMGAKAYFRSEPFANAGIEVLWQNFQHPVYPQLYDDFVPYLSSIDLLLNCGIDQSRKILRNE
jgi:hypothetical protein